MRSKFTYNMLLIRISYGALILTPINRNCCLFNFLHSALLMITSRLSDSVYRYGITFSNDLKGKYTESIVRYTSRKLVPCVVLEHFSLPGTIIRIYFSTIRPWSKYYCHGCFRSYGMYFEIFKMQTISAIFVMPYLAYRLQTLSVMNHSFPVPFI